MHYQEFQRLAIASLLGSQEDNGSWLNDEAATCAALEVLLEDMFGPLASWRHSWIGSHIRGRGINSWPLMFSYGVRSGEESVNEQKLAAVWKGINFGRGRVQHSNLWLSIKWNNLFSFIDFDARPITLERPPTGVQSDEPWLLAQLAKYFLYADRRYIDLEEQLEACGVLIPLIRQLLASVESDHWVSKDVSQEEATAIVSQFLFHPGVSYVLAGMRDRTSEAVEKTLDDKLALLKTAVFSWLRRHQGEGGSWGGGSPAITVHCVEALITAFESPQGDVLCEADKAAVVRAIQWLLSEEVVAWWDALRSYQQIAVILLLQRLSSVEVFNEMFDRVQVVSRLLTRDVFISYGGCDREFAYRLAGDLEARGIRVWFAEWDIDYGDDIVEEIQKGLDETTTFLIVVSPEAVNRKWVRQELSAAFHQALDGKESVVIPIMFKECKPPAFVRTKKWVDFTNLEKYDAKVVDLARRLRRRKIKRR
jgi:TIR domain